MKVILKPGKERSLQRRHPWIFSGAVESIPQISPGEIVSVFSHDGQFLAQAAFHPEQSLVGRVLSFQQGDVRDHLAQQIKSAIAWRKSLFDEANTNAYRLINAEGDGISGLVVDKYNASLVMQIGCWGIERLRPFFLETLETLLKPEAIYEKSVSSSRRKEGLPDREEWVFGARQESVAFLENGLNFTCNFEKGQKTGFFLDQREMRSLVERYANGKRVLNCFSYSGGFSLYALRGGATHVTSVDRSEEACKEARIHTEKNGFAQHQHNVVCADCFTFLETAKEEYDFIILDPPAFAKKREDIQEACKGYKELNKLALRKLPPKSLLLTCSCSHYIEEDLFQNLLFQAALEAGRTVKIIGRHLLAPDHPILIYHPEGGYIKSLLLWVE